MSPTYEVLADVTVEEATASGLVRSEFKAGIVTDPSPDAVHELELTLIPAGLAKRTDAVAPVAEPEPAQSAAVVPPIEDATADADAVKE